MNKHVWVLLEESSFAQDQAVSSWNTLQIQGKNGKDIFRIWRAGTWSAVSQQMRFLLVKFLGWAWPYNHPTPRAIAARYPFSLSQVLVSFTILSLQGLKFSAGKACMNPQMVRWECQCSTGRWALEHIGTPLSEKHIPVTIFHPLGPAEAPTP